MSETSYLVFFLTEPVDDGLARVVRARVRAMGAGFFDDPDAPDPASRTTGGYLRLTEPDPAAELAFCEHAAALSRDLRVEVELQWHEAVLGRVSGGVPDPPLADWLSLRRP